MKITIVGLGPWQGGYLTEKAVHAMKANTTVFRTAKHPEAAVSRTVKAIYLDQFYRDAEDFEALGCLLADKVIQCAREHDSIVYAVPGQGITGEGSVQELLKRAGDEIEIDVIPGVEESAVLLAGSAHHLQAGAQQYAVCPAAQLDISRVNRTVPLVITQLDDRFIAGELKLKLIEKYGETADVYSFTDGTVEKHALFEIDRLAWYDHTTMVLIPAHVPGAARYDLYDIVGIMDKLRGMNGCPWDREQTHESLKQYLLEESYEVIEAIDRDNMAELCDELGDVLLQVVFHARIAGERGDFDIEDVSNAVSRKMINRHPHIFGSVSAETSEQVLQNWEEIKKLEKGQDSNAGMMRQIPKALPAMIKSMKVQGKAAHVGFDWADVWGAFDKLEEEVGELKAEIHGQGDPGRLEDEMGDVLFAAINVARFIKVHPEFALESTVNKFVKRFSYIESEAKRAGKSLENMTLDEMETLWQEAKTMA